ncbi:MAG: hypothetical protein JWN86_2152 [Planctomycetota bacterium]|nr:hypothetical protein [Planctomycetota bacterium]
MIRRLVPSIAILSVLLVPSTTFSQSPGREDVARLTQSARNQATGVLLVGDPQRGQGTAFVISRKHRLAATAAHVADLYQGPGTIVAVVNGSIAAYRVTKVWYHPSLRRSLDGSLTVRSPDAIDGSVAVPGPDVAVLQLEDGPELPTELTLAGPDEAGRLLGKPIALLGYPGYADWPTQSRLAVATLHPGIVRTHDTYTFFDGGHPGSRQVLEHSAATPEGSSGSPVFLPDGKVVGIHNILRLQGPEGDVQSGMSVRVDALWELLVYHGLANKIPAASRPWDVFVPAEPAAEPRRENLRRAVRLVRKAEALTAKNEHRAAGEKCNEAIQLAPEYAGAYLQRSRAFTGYCGTNWTLLSPSEKRKQAGWAIDDAKTGFLLSPERTEGLCLLLQNSLFLGHLDGDRAVFQETIAGADEVLARKHLNAHDRSFLTNCRGQARHYLGDWGGALRDYSESIRLAPSEPFWYVNRAQYWDQRGRPDLAAADRRTAQALQRR